MPKTPIDIIGRVLTLYHIFKREMPKTSWRFLPIQPALYHIFKREMPKTLMLRNPLKINYITSLNERCRKLYCSRIHSRSHYITSLNERCRKFFLNKRCQKQITICDFKLDYIMVYFVKKSGKKGYFSNKSIVKYFSFLEKSLHNYILLFRISEI